MDGITILNWFKNILLESNKAIEYLNTPSTIGNWTVTPIELISITGLIGFVGVALVMWVVSSVS